MSSFFRDKSNFDSELDRMIAHDPEIKMGERLRSHIDRFLPKMEPGSTFLDAGCHLGYMYHILINEMKLDIKYSGIDVREDYVEFANRRFGPYFEVKDFMDETRKFDYVWCTQMPIYDVVNKIDSSAIGYFRHLAGLAKKKIVFSRVTWDTDILEKIKDDTFEIIIA